MLPNKKAIHPVIAKVAEDLAEKSEASRSAYLERMQFTKDNQPPKRTLSCGNLAHGYAACSESDKQRIRLMQSANIGIVTAYNDMLSAHQPFKDYPDQIKQRAHSLGSTAQVAGGVPAMCDGVTQGQPGMELSLFSRDVIAMATAISLSHNIFDAALCLGVCDKIVPGMLIGALEFGFLPVGFIPAGPMPTGISNKEKAAVRQAYAAGKASKEELLAAESASYHSPGTCTFYGTANTNQLLMEAMGVQLPGASFVNPDAELRPAFTNATVDAVIKASQHPSLSLSALIDEKAIINALVALLASGGSTNHTLHLVAIARAAGYQLTWDDFSEVSRVVPLLMRVYPNGSEDVNAFQRAGGTAYLFYELMNNGLMFSEKQCLLGESMEVYCAEPTIAPEKVAGVEEKLSCTVTWKKGVNSSKNTEVLSSVATPFDKEGGIHVLHGNLGTAVIKTSAVENKYLEITAPCEVFDSQDALKAKYESGALEKDFIAVVRFQGPQANGMPELHQLTPYLGNLQDKGYNIALVTDGRMSGASGKVPAAIHLSPEALNGGLIAKLKTGDIISLNALAGKLQVNLTEDEIAKRSDAVAPHIPQTLGRHLFEGLRKSAGSASNGGSVFDI